jgi:hypothetical protein
VHEDAYMAVENSSPHQSRLTQPGAKYLSDEIISRTSKALELADIVRARQWELQDWEAF